jgi:aspartyl-tRNA(Asn)/glutamyl-tRNA(Gln) amidotransferase subunit A
MSQRSHDEMVASARVAGVELDEQYVQLAAQAMEVWWDEVVAVRQFDLGGMADAAPLEPRTAPLVHPSHPVPLGSSARPGSASVSRPTDLADCSVTELLGLFASGEASPTEALDACVTRIANVDGHVHAVMHLAEDEARAQARESDQRWRRGDARALEGVPYGLKDNIRTRRIPTTGGSKVLTGHVPTESAHAVQRLDRAGAVMLAKLATTEFACGGALSPWYGAVHNPWDFDRFSGSSSSGPGAAVAAGLVPFALGTDTLGSIRVPASCTGVVGWKPTYGAVSRRGVMPLSWTMDHVGPLARSVEDAARVLQVISGPDAGDESCFVGSRPDLLAALDDSSLHGLRIGVARSYYEPLADALVIAAIDEAIEVLRRRGATIVDVEIDHVEHAFGAGWLALLCEGASLHEDLWTRPDEYDPGLVFRLLVGKLAPATDYVRALRMRTLLQNSFQRTFDSVDAILFPGMVSSSPRYDDLFFDVNGTKHALQKMHARFTAPGNATGLPALCIPAGVGRNGMPVAFQIYAPAHRDDVCARIGHAFQLDTNHHRAIPTALGAVLHR